MANNYTQFSSTIAYETPEQRDWLLNALASQHEPDEPEGEEWLLHVCDFEDSPDDHYVWISEWECGDLGVLTDVVCKYQTKFGIGTPFEVEWADVCSKPRIGEFGGGALLCYKGEAHWMNTTAWLISQEKQLGIQKAEAT